MMRTDSKEMTVIRGIASCIVLLLCLGGCSTIDVQHSRGSCGPVETGDALTLVFDYGHGSRSLEDDAQLEVRLSQCLQQALKEGGQGVTLIPPDEFRRVVFPDLDFTFGPPRAETLLSLLEVPHFRQKTDALHLRYLIGVEEGTGSSHDGGFAFLIAGTVHHKWTYLAARLTDMKNPSEMGEVSITAGSTGVYLIMAPFIPFIWPATTESPACKRFGTEIIKFISGETQNTPAGDTP